MREKRIDKLNNSSTSHDFGKAEKIQHERKGHRKINLEVGKF